MPLTIKLPSNPTCPQQVLIPYATTETDGLMSPLMAAKLAVLASTQPMPAVDIPAEIVFNPLFAGALQGTLLPDASPNNDGCITAFQVRQLNALFASSGNPTPVAAADAPIFIRYDASGLNSKIIAVLQPASAHSGGVMTAKQFLQLQALGVGGGLSGVNGSLVTDGHIYPHPIFPFGHVQLNGVAGFTGTETGTITVTGAAQAGMNQVWNLFAVYGPTSVGLFGNTQSPPVTTPDANNPNIHWVYTPGP